MINNYSERLEKLDVVTRKFGKYSLSVIKEDGTKGKYLYEFIMYRTEILFEAKPLMWRGELRSGYVPIKVYGLIVLMVWFEGTERRDKLVRDFGPLSGQQYEVNALMQGLWRAKYPVVDLREQNAYLKLPNEIINDIHKEQAASWTRNDWGTPFGKVAEDALREKLREGDSVPEPINKSVNLMKQKRRNPQARLFDMFQSGTKNDEGMDV